VRLRQDCKLEASLGYMLSSGSPELRNETLSQKNQ
jgi:hypothetical protein